jgi:hypothetical protein
LELSKLEDEINAHVHRFEEAIHRLKDWYEDQGYVPGTSLPKNLVCRSGKHAIKWAHSLAHKKGAEQLNFTEQI